VRNLIFIETAMRGKREFGPIKIRQFLVMRICTTMQVNIDLPASYSLMVSSSNPSAACSVLTSLIIALLFVASNQLIH
jgi:hypothetical protein